jgi:cell wall-associated NlpC family hydrolase
MNNQNGTQDNTTPTGQPMSDLQLALKDYVSKGFLDSLPSGQQSSSMVPPVANSQTLDTPGKLPYPPIDSTNQTNVPLATPSAAQTVPSPTWANTMNNGASDQGFINALNIKTPPLGTTPDQKREVSSTAQATTEAVSNGASPELLNNAKKMLGAQAYIGLCESFVENATGSGWQGTSAIDAWNNNSNVAQTDMSKIKPGDKIYFGADASNGYFGHTGIYTGNNQFISATYNGIQENDLSNWVNSTGQRVLGFLPGSGKIVNPNLPTQANSVKTPVNPYVNKPVQKVQPVKQAVKVAPKVAPKAMIKPVQAPQASIIGKLLSMIKK